MPTSAEAPAGEATPAEAPEGYSLTGLRMLSQAISGRPLEVRPEPLVDPRAYVTGNAIVVEESLTFAARDQVVVQAAMLAAGSFEPRVMRALMGRGRSTSRYCALEGVRAVRVLGGLIPPSV